MRCLEANEILAFVGRPHEDPARAAVDEHLAECDDCRRAVAAAVRDDGDDVIPTVGTRVGRYTLRRLRGRGAMGLVFVAHDPELDREVALKLVAPSLIDDRDTSTRRLLQEARALAALAHPNVVSVFDAGTSGPHVFLAMELIVGQTATEWLASQPRSVDAILSVFDAAGRGLEAAHTAGLVHRDFKTDNVLVTADGVVKVADFGLATSQSRRPSDGTGPRPERGEVRGHGTPAFMAPEQHRGDRVDARTDQFSFCVALYRALYREPPFSGDTSEALLESAERGPPPLRPIDALTRRRRAAIQRGLSSRPEERFDSMSALLHELAPRPRRWPLVAAAGLVALGVGWAANASRPVCQGVDGTSIWGDAVQARLQPALERARSAQREGAVRRIGEALRTYRDAWLTTHRQVCEATRVHGHQSEDVMQARMRCLGQARRRAEVLVEHVATSVDERGLDAAVGAAWTLPEPSSCTDDVDPARPPRHAELNDLERRAAELEQKLALADLDRVAEAEALLDEARGFGHPALVARALLLLAGFELERGDFDAAEPHTREGIDVASTVARGQLLARLWTLLIAIRTAQGEYVAAREVGAASLAAIRLARAPPLLEARALLRIGDLLTWEMDYAAASANVERALDVARTAGAPGRPLAIRATLLLSAISSELSRPADALTHARAAVKMAEPIYDERHRVRLATRFNLGQAKATAGDFDAGVTLMQDALREDVRLRGGGPDQAYAYDELGEALSRAGRCPEALESFAAGLALVEAPDEPAGYDVALLERGRAHCLAVLGRWAEARSALDRALSIAIARRGADHPATARVHIERARVAQRAGDTTELRRALDAARAMLILPRDRWLADRIEALEREP
ncbi:MAG: serine/threonine-protein kinase [Deltaproteobacteria bacterium]